MNHVQSVRVTRFVLLAIIAALCLVLGYHVGAWISHANLAVAYSAQTRITNIDGAVW